MALFVMNSLLLYSNFKSFLGARDPGAYPIGISSRSEKAAPRFAPVIFILIESRLNKWFIKCWSIFRIPICPDFQPCSKPIRVPYSVIFASSRASFWKSSWSEWLWSQSMIFTQIVKVIVFNHVHLSPINYRTFLPLSIGKSELSFEGHFSCNKMLVGFEFIRPDSKLRRFIVHFLGRFATIHFINQLFQAFSNCCPRRRRFDMWFSTNHIVSFGHKYENAPQFLLHLEVY